MKVGDWYRKFACAIAGVGWALRTQNSFRVHLAAVVAVTLMGCWLQIDAWRWVAICIAMTLVLAMELMNTAVEQLVKVLHPEHDQTIGRALDIAAGSVLVTAIGSVVVGLLVLGPPLWATIFP